MKSFLALFFTLTSVLAHPVPEPEPVPGNVTVGLLKRAGMIFSSCTVPNTVALTFDDGPYQFMNDIGDTLNRAGARGTFFINGRNWDCVYNYQSQINHVYSQGHQLGSHTWSHAHLTDLSWDQINGEMSGVELALQRIIGVQPAWVRPPYGGINDQVIAAANARGQNVALWDFDSGDTTGLPAEQSKNMYRDFANRRPSSILALNHEVIPSTVFEVLPVAIDVLQRAGYQLVTVAECVGQNPYQWVGAPQTPGPDWHC